MDYDCIIPGLHFPRALGWGSYSTNTDSDVVLTFKEHAFWWGRYTNIR